MKDAKDSFQNNLIVVMDILKVRLDILTSMSHLSLLGWFGGPQLSAPCISIYVYIIKSLSI